MIYYLGIRFDKATKKALNKIRSNNNLQDFKMPNLNYHPTIIHSKTPFNIKLPTMPQNLIGFTSPKVHLFGESLVLIYESSFCLDLHKSARLGGAVWDHQSFIPHITFAEGIVAYNLQDIKSPQIPINIQEIFYREWPERNQP